jgi:hypothetical protein
LALPATLATTTSHQLSALSAFRVPVTRADGKLDPSFYATSTKHQIQVFTVTGDFLVPEGVTRARVIVQAAGGNGGSDSLAELTPRAATTSFGTFIEAQGGASLNSDNPSPGGGAGAYCEGVVDLTGTTSVRVTIGAAATPADNNNGPDTVSANQGGDGGDCSGTTLGLFEVDDVDGYPIIGTNWSGPGAGSPLGVGGPARLSTSSSPARGFGAGGGGTSNDTTGGLGAPGVVIVYW